MFIDNMIRNAILHLPIEKEVISMGFFNAVFDELNATADTIAKQTLGIKPGKKKRPSRKSRQVNRPVVKIYKEIHQHRHFHDYKAFNKK